MYTFVQEMDDPMIVMSHQSQMSSMEDSTYSASLSPQGGTTPPGDSSSSFFRSEDNSRLGTTTPAAKMLKTTRKIIPKPSSTIISFHNATSATAQYNEDNGNDISSVLMGMISEGSRKASATTRNPLQAQDHVIAERQRRERLSQMFIQLSSLVPGLKKVLKISPIKVLLTININQ